MYHAPYHDYQALKERVTEAIRSVTVEMLQNTWYETEYRLDVFKGTNEPTLRLIEFLVYGNKNFMTYASSVSKIVVVLCSY